MLLRFFWPVMERTLATPPVRQELLTGVEDVAIRFLDASGQWHLDWPPLEMPGAQRLIARPRAVEFAVELEGFGRVWRLVETGG
jgi:type II secretion system protein J